MRISSPLRRSAHRTPLVRALQGAVGAPNVVYLPEDLLAYEYDATIERRTAGAAATNSACDGGVASGVASGAAGSGAFSAVAG